MARVIGKIEDDRAWKKLRRPSFDTVGIKINLRKPSTDVAEELLPKWVFRILLLGGGPSGDEHLWKKTLFFVVAGANMAIAIADLWLVGLRFLPDLLVVGSIGMAFNLACFIVRWKFLQSGILWAFGSARDALSSGDLSINPFGDFDGKCLRLIVFNMIEGIVVFGAVIVLGLNFDISGRAASAGKVARNSLWVANILNMCILHPVTHATIKLLPMFFVATYDFVVEDMHGFHKKVDELFARSDVSEQERTDVLEELQLIEKNIRTSLALVNAVMSPKVGIILGLILAIMFGCIVIAILQVRHHEGSVVVTGFFCWVACVMGFLALDILGGAAQVGDRWLKLVDDLNTPILCSRTTAVLGLPLSERLMQLQEGGIRVCGCTLNSRTVFAMSSTIISSLALALLGTMLTS